MARAIAGFERTVLSTESPFDRWGNGDDEGRHAAREARLRGVQAGKGNCVVCHMGSNFTDNGYHNIGIKHAKARRGPGPLTCARPLVLKGAFKTPTLRDIELTGPYMHNGTPSTLMEVVDHYDRGGDDKDNLSINMVPLRLTSEEKPELVAFMQTLDGVPMQVSVPALPR